MADSYHGTDNFTAPSEESKALEFDTTQSIEEEEDNDVTQMGKEIVEYKSIPSKSGRRVRRRLSSEMWEVFVKLPRSSDGRERNKCKLCGKVCLCESILATGNMKRHLKMCPKMKIHDVDQLFESASEGGSSSDSDRKDPQVFQELVTAAIIMHDLPLRFFEWSHIRKMIEFVSDDVNLVSKETTEMDVLKVHRREKEGVKTTLEEAYGRVCLTAEWWTAMNTDNYMCVTAHFLDKNWVLQKRMLDFCWMPTPHDVVSLTNKFNTLLWEWGIDKKLCSLTLDNALSDKSFVNNLKRLLNLRKPLVCNGDFLHIHCCAHILDLIVQDGLKDINDVVRKIRESIICVKVSTELRQKFLECIKQVSLDCKKGLRQDIPTIWNSTYLMLENALYYRRACKNCGEKNSFSMEEYTNKKKSDDNNGRLVVDTSMADKSMWLIKCPPSLSRSLRDIGDDPTRPVAKLLLSIDPLSSSNDEFSSPQFTMPMEMIGNESGNAPKCYYSMDVSQDVTPLSVLTESSSQGNIAVEGKINKKFDMRPHQDSMEKNGKLSIERKSRFKTKNSKTFQDALLEANEVFVSFKQKNKKMAKSIKELKKQNVLLDITVMELDEECEHLKKQLKETKNQKEKLESLCRSLRAEKKHNSVEEQQL
ncbi:hypothetical protein EZV62_025444 [Acer yangbiense]|uniref:BED-type domain-containing protein n=1 Tax=Acer yangbiense TaxID=1000413 RepID=A0A5C7GYG8_9ROSI|nr:hypothetical protein EZV62_025444 [Acer yangbiense]